MLEAAGHGPLSEKLRKHQMIYMGQLARRDYEDPVRRTVFETSGIELRLKPGARSRGQPRQTWARAVLNDCLRVAGSMDQVKAFFRTDKGAANPWALAVEACHL